MNFLYQQRMTILKWKISSQLRNRSFHLFASSIVLVVGLVVPGTIFGQVPAEETVKQFKHAENLEVTLWASEPMLSNPTNMDIDSRGRIWVTEGLNYRLFNIKNFKRVPKADAIKILEDTNKDGKADKVTIFAENLFPVPMGIAIEEIYNEKGEQTGTRVYVGNAPNLLVLEDTDGDDRADKKYNLLSGFGAVDSDHGLHGMFLAMDGKLYFTHGDGKYGEPNQYKKKKDLSLVYDITDQSGRRIIHKDRGSTLRVNLDGSHLEILGIRFRNNYEVCVDSFGRVFVSDNDDDGNRGSRMVWVMRGGNYGYQIPESNHHWAEDLPGYVPKIAGTGNGSPAGILIYEGDLFGEEVKGSVLQIDARTRQINLHPITRTGAGVRTEYKILLTGDDSWYRPIDASVGPDGAIYIIDWYDAGVGGNRFADQTTGRIYRFAPKGTSPKFQPADFKNVHGLIKGIQSPVTATRFAARQQLVKRQPESFEAVKQLYLTGSPQLKGRALQILYSMGEQGKNVLRQALQNPDPSIRELSLQLLSRNLITNQFSRNKETPQINQSLLKELIKLKNDTDAGVKRELLLALQNVPTSYIRRELINLALAWDGQDRYYLEAILLAVKKRSNGIKKEILDLATDRALKYPEQLNRDLALPPYFPTATNDGFLRPDDQLPTGNPASIVIGLAWGLEWEGSIDHLEQLLNASDSPAILKGVELAASRLPAQQAGIFFAKQFMKEKEVLRKKELLGILGSKFKDSKEQAFENSLISQIIESSLKTDELQSTAVRVIGKIRTSRYTNQLMEFVSDESVSPAVRASAIYALGRLKHQPLSGPVKNIIDQTLETNQVTPLVKAAIQAYANLNADKSITLMKSILEDPEHGLAMKREALRVLASSKNGGLELLKMAKGDLIPKPLYVELVSLTHNHPDQNIRRVAREEIPLPPSANGKPLPPVAELLSRTGNPRRGEEIFFRENVQGKQAPQCSLCHRVQGRGNSIGPDLSTIGVKFGKGELLESILNPSGAISYNFQTEIFQMEDGRTFYGLIASETTSQVILKTAQKEQLVLEKSEIEERQPGSISIMPEGLAQTTTEQELIDLLAFMTTLRKPTISILNYSLANQTENISNEDEIISSAFSKHAQTSPGKKAPKLSWQNLTAGKAGKLIIEKTIHSSKPQDLFVMFTVSSSIEQPAKIVFESGMKLKVWTGKTNGILPTRTASNKSSYIEVDLKKGTNPFLIRLGPTSPTDSLSTSVVSEVAVQIKQ